MSKKINCPMCSGKKVFKIKTFFLESKGNIVFYKARKLCPICKGTGSLITT